MATADAKTPEENYATTDAKTPEEDKATTDAKTPKENSVLNFERAYNLGLENMYKEPFPKKALWLDERRTENPERFVEDLFKAFESRPRKKIEDIKEERVLGVDFLIAERLKFSFKPKIPEKDILTFIDEHLKSKKNEEFQNLQITVNAAYLGQHYEILTQLHVPLIKADKLGCTADMLTQEKVINNHKILAKKMSEMNGGEFRQENYKPKGYDFDYAPYGSVKSRLEALMKVVRAHYTGLRGDKTKDGLVEIIITKDGLVKIIKLATFFLGEFLYIHPFCNGNGRIARFMTNIILSPIAAAPICFYLGSEEEKKRKYYCDSLAEIHRYKGSSSEDWSHLLLGVLYNLWSVQDKV